MYTGVNDVRTTNDKNMDGYMRDQYCTSMAMGCLGVLRIR